MEIPDSELVAQTLNGNIQAFGQLVRKYQGAVYGLAYLYVRNFHDAQDALPAKLSGEGRRKKLF